MTTSTSTPDHRPYGEPTCRACQTGGQACHNHRTPADPKAIVAALSAADLDAVIDGRKRIGEDRSLDLAIWNAAIDRAND